MREEIMRFLGDVNRPVAVATVYKNTPKVRFFSFKMVEEGELYFITSTKKNVFQELQENNRVELCTLADEDMNWIRIAAEVEFVKNLDLNKKAFTLLPLLKMAYGDPSNEEIVLLRMTHMDIKKYGMGKDVETLEF